MKKEIQHPGKILKALAQIAGLTPEDLALRSGMSLIRITDILAGRRRLMRDSAQHLARIFPEPPWTDWLHWLQLQSAYEDKRPVPVLGGQKKPRRDSGRKIPEDVREKVLELVDDGMSSEQAGEVVGLKKMSVAGIRSADTKGLYS